MRNYTCDRCGNPIQRSLIKASIMQMTNEISDESTISDADRKRIEYVSERDFCSFKCMAEHILQHAGDL